MDGAFCDFFGKNAPKHLRDIYRLEKGLPVDLGRAMILYILYEKTIFQDGDIALLEASGKIRDQSSAKTNRVPGLEI